MGQSWTACDLQSEWRYVPSKTLPPISVDSSSAYVSNHRVIHIKNLSTRKLLFFSSSHRPFQRRVSMLQTERRLHPCLVSQQDGPMPRHSFLLELACGKFGVCFTPGLPPSPLRRGFGNGCFATASDGPASLDVRKRHQKSRSPGDLVHTLWGRRASDPGFLKSMGSLCGACWVYN